MDPNELPNDAGGAQGNVDMEEQMAQWREYAFNQLEEKITDWFGDLRERVRTRRATDWRDKQEARELAHEIEEAGRGDEYIEDSLLDIQQRMLRVIFTGLDQHQNPDADTADLTDEFAEFLIELHNPSTQEGILLAMQPEYRDLFRDRFDEIGSNLWGLFEIINGIDGEDRWYFLDTLAALNGQSLEDTVRQTEGVSVDEIPDELRQ